MAFHLLYAIGLVFLMFCFKAQALQNRVIGSVSIIFPLASEIAVTTPLREENARRCQLPSIDIVVSGVTFKSVYI